MCFVLIQTADHPRLRGEHLYQLCFGMFHLGSPPLTRGTRSLYLISALSLWITPAYAGNTLLLLLGHLELSDHPRLRGEHPKPPGAPPVFAGSPPLTRGTLILPYPSLKACRITPAYAGNTKRSSSDKSLIKDHPRLRGEHFFMFVFFFYLFGSPPLTRGTLDRKTKRRRNRRITPAYAGNTFYQIS